MPWHQPCPGIFDGPPSPGRKSGSRQTQPAPPINIILGWIGHGWSRATLFDPGQDGLTLGVSFGPGFNDGEIHSTSSDRKSLGSNVLFRVAGEIGYQITPRYNVSAYLDHISNGGFAKYNDSINDLGLRFGYKF